MAPQRHQHPRPLRRSHGTLPPSPGRGIPPNGHARPHSHHRRHERRPHPSGPRGTGHTPGPSSPRHHRNAGARGPNSQPRRPTIPLPPPNGCRPIPHRRMLWRPHHHHPSGGPIWTTPAGTHRPEPPAHPPQHPQPSPQPPRRCGPRPTTPPEDAPAA